MIYSWRVTTLSFFIAIFFLCYSCVTKVYPDERMAIDSSFKMLFNSLISKDTFAFTDLMNHRKVFAITKLDSIVSNEKGWFINQSPYKLLRIRFKDLGTDTPELDRENEIYVMKDPKTAGGSIGIQFNNFYFTDSIIPSLNHDTIDINGKKIIDYYLFETSLKLKHPDDVKELYISPVKGFIGFKTVSGEVWLNELE